MKKKINYNVIGVMSGEEELDWYVFVGKYWDVFFFRVVGIVYGFIFLMEVVWVFGNLWKDGWKLWRIFKLWSRGSLGVWFNRLGWVGWGIY